MKGSVPILALGLLLAGCVVGPNYRGPPAPPGTMAPAFVRAGDAPVSSAPPVARWWEMLDDPTLTMLEDRALAANPDLDAATARLRQARAALLEQRASQRPSASAMALAAHARLPGINIAGNDSSDTTNTSAGQSTELDFYNVGFNASWEIDLFGGAHRTIEAARANADVAEANLADAQVSLTAEVAQAYVNIRDLQRRLALTGQAIALQEQMLALTRQRFEHGTASLLDLDRPARDLDSARADAMPINAELEAYLDELATLTGDAPGALDQTMATVRPLPLPPARVAVGDPATLLRRRPDIRAAERTLAVDTARIGVADAARFPQLSFMGLIGIGGTHPEDLTHLDDFTALLAPRLSWSFLDFGRNAAKVRQADAVRDEAEAKYRATVLAALKDAEAALARFRYRRATVASLARAEAEADEAAGLSRQRYAAGTTTLVDVLDVERQRIATEQSLSMAEAGLTGDFVGIQKALGLGWSEPAAASIGSVVSRDDGGGQPRSR